MYFLLVSKSRRGASVISPAIPLSTLPSPRAEGEDSHSLWNWRQPRARNALKFHIQCRHFALCWLSSKTRSFAPQLIGNPFHLYKFVVDLITKRLTTALNTHFHSITEQCGGDISVEYKHAYPHHLSLSHIDSQAIVAHSNAMSGIRPIAWQLIKPVRS